METSQQVIAARDALRKIRLESAQTRSLHDLRERFAELQALRRQTLDDFDLQVMVADIHQEIIDRARYLRGENIQPRTPLEDPSVIFEAPLVKRGEVGVATVAKASRKEAFQVAPPVSGEPSDAAEIPPEVPRIDPKSWQVIVGLATFLTVVALVGFFNLIQAARKANFGDQTTQSADQTARAKNQTNSGQTVSITPTLRLYTDLVPSLVNFDNQPPQNLSDGELVLDNLQAGHHVVKLSGASGASSFEFDVAPGKAPKISGQPQANNALTILVSQQEGRGLLVSSGGKTTILLDGTTIGDADAGGLQLNNLGTADHDLQVIHNRDRERFVMTYTPAPVLTAYVKSDPNTGILQVVTGVDGADVYIENVLFRRKTEHGQLRFSVRAGKYPIRVHKDGYADPPQAWVEVKKADVAQIRFEMQPRNDFGMLQIHGAQAGTTAYLDKEFVAAIGADGNAQISNIKPGEHTIELRHDPEGARRLLRSFRGGETVTLSGNDVIFEKAPTDAKTAPAPSKPALIEHTGQPAAPPAAPENAADNAHVQKGGGFVTYGTPHAAGHYSFRTQGHVGGVFKRSKLQWYAGFHDGQNYVLFVLDGKHAEVREMRQGKIIQWNRVPFDVASSSWVQVDLSVKQSQISARVRANGDVWQELGSVTSTGRDFTEDKVGIYVPPNDEVAVANFKFANR